MVVKASLHGKEASILLCFILFVRKCRGFLACDDSTNELVHLNEIIDPHPNFKGISLTGG